MEKHIQTRQLLYFVEASRSGSLLKSAEKLGVSQPAITSAIQKLEATLGAKLLTRNRQGVRLTAYGRVFIEHAVKVLSELNVGFSRVQAARNAEFGHINVGVLPITASPLLPLAIARFKQAHPRVAITVSPTHNDKLLPSLRLGELDFVVGYPGGSELMEGLDTQALFEEQLWLVTRKSHPLAARPLVRPADLVNYPWFITHPYTEFRDVVIKLFAGMKISFPTNFVEGNYHIANEYLRVSDSIAVLPYNLVAHYVEGGILTLLNVRQPLPTCSVHITRRTEDDLTPAAKDLIHAIYAVGLELSAKQTRSLRSARSAASGR